MKKTYQIEVDCAVCASRCAEAINRLDGVISCKINYIMQEMEFHAADTGYDEILSNAIKVARRIEPDFEVIDEL